MTENSQQNTVKLLVGLGNPGNKYDRTRHNAGQDWVLQLAQNKNIVMAPEKRFFGLYGQGLIAGEKVHCLIPTVFMNLSGQAVQAVCNFYKIEAANVLIAHDELDLPPGVARFKQAGGHGGHNGLRSIISCLGGNKDFYRLRLGIGHPGHAKDVSAYVLKAPPKNEYQLLQTAMTKALLNVDKAILGYWQKAMNDLHSETP